MVRRGSLAGQAAKVRQFRERHVHAEGGAFALVVRERLGPGLAAGEPCNDLRVGVCHHATRKDLALARECQAGCPPLAAHDRLHGDTGADRHAPQPRLLGQRLRDRPHSPDRVSPDAGLAVHLAEDVVQEHVGGAGGPGAREVADDAVEPEAGLDRIGLEPALEPVPGGEREEVQHVLLRLQRQAV